MDIEQLALIAKHALDSDPDLIIETELGASRILICRTGVDPNEYRVSLERHDQSETGTFVGILEDSSDLDSIRTVVQAYLEDGGLPQSIQILAVEEFDNIAAGSENQITLEVITEDKNLSAIRLFELSRSDDWEIRAGVALHENTPAELIDKLSEDDDIDVRASVVNRELPADWKTLGSQEMAVRLSRKNVPFSVLLVLAKSPHPMIRRVVAIHPGLTEPYVSLLKGDEDPSVSYLAEYGRKLPFSFWFEESSVSGNLIGDIEIPDRILSFSLSQDDLVQLSMHPYAPARAAVALNPNTPPTVIQKLESDELPDVRYAVLKRKLSADLQVDDDELVDKLKQGQVSADALSILAKSTNYLVRRAVGLCDSCPKSLLSILSKDDDSDVRSSVRERVLPSDWKFLDEDELVDRLSEENEIDPHVLEILAQSGSCAVQQAVAMNPSCPSEVRVLTGY